MQWKGAQWHNCSHDNHGYSGDFYTDDDSDGLFYTSQDLEYIYFVHSLCLLGRVLLYSGGRALFPVILPDTDGRIHYIILLFIGKFAKQRVLNQYLFNISPQKFFVRSIQTKPWYFHQGNLFFHNIFAKIFPVDLKKGLFPFVQNQNLYL